MLKNFSLFASCLLLALPARADISYGVDATIPAPGFGRLHGAFVVPTAAIADGILRAEEITSAEFTLSETQAPFQNAVFTANERIAPFLNFDNGDTFVDRVTGMYFSRFNFVARDTETAQVLLFLNTGFTVQSAQSSSTAIGLAVDATVSGGGSVGAAGGGPGGGGGDNYVYTFTTTTPAPTAGRIVGSFTVPKSAVTDGVLTASEVTSSNFQLVDATAPFVSGPIEMYSEFSSPYGNEIRVNPSTGTYLHDFLWPGRDSLRQNFYLLPHRFMINGVGGQQYALGNLTVLGDAPTGGGVVGAVPTPALGRTALMLLCLLVAAAAVRFLGMRGHR